MPWEKNIWLSKLAFPTLLSYAGQMIFQIMKERLKSCEAFSLALDESADISDTVQLVIFIGAVTADFDIIEKFLDIAGLTFTTTGQDIYEQMLKVVGKF